MMATMSPKRPMASAKIRIRIMPTKSLGWMAFMRTPTSPTTPIAKPEAYKINKILIRDGHTKPEKPQQIPAAKCL